MSYWWSETKYNKCEAKSQVIIVMRSSGMYMYVCVCAEEFQVFLCSFFGVTVLVLGLPFRKLTAS